MRSLDEQEKAIVRQLVRNPRATDKSISDATGVQLRTVGRKRQRLENEGLLSYWASMNLGTNGTGQYQASHLFIIKFALGVTYENVCENIRRTPEVPGYTEIIAESQIAEIDGSLALMLVVDGPNDREIVQSVHARIIPALLKNHGAAAIKEISTIRLLGPVRVMRNYLPLVNMKNGRIRPDWPESAIYVGG